MLITRYRLLLLFFPLIILIVFFLNIDDNDTKDYEYQKIAIAYSPYRDNIVDGVSPTAEEIGQDLQLLSVFSNHVRTYTSIEYAGTVLSIAQNYGILVDIGLNITNDKEQNDKEIGSLFYLLGNYDNIRAIIIGNDYLHNKSVDKEIILDVISYVRPRIPDNILISSSNPASTWWEENDELINLLDFVSINSYPYWRGIDIDESINSFFDEYEQTKLKLLEKNYSKPIIVGETNWPSNGKIICSAVPGPENQLFYLSEIIKLSQQKNIEFFVFEAFDETWKSDYNVPELDNYLEQCLVKDEPLIHTEKNWGLFNAERKLKDHLKPLIANIVGYNPSIKINKEFFTNDVVIDIVLDENDFKSDYVLFVELSPLSQNSNYKITLELDKNKSLTYNTNFSKIIKIPLNDNFSVISLTIHDLGHTSIISNIYVLPSIIAPCEYEENCIELIEYT